VYLGAEYVNSEVMSDVTFLVEGKKFNAHRIALLASSDTFKAMFDGGYREKEASTIPIPNIRYCVFEAMMHCIYTGDVEVPEHLAEEMLQAADQYMLDRLKQLCEERLEGALSVDSLQSMVELSESFNASHLGRKCTLFALANFTELSQAMKDEGELDFTSLLKRILPKLKVSITEQLQKKAP
jgi:hypothetical protein